MILKKNPEVVYSNLDSEVFLFNPNKGLYMNLNATGSIIWNLLDKFSTFEEIANELKEIFEVENSNYVEELKIFIEESQNFEILLKDE